MDHLCTFHITARRQKTKCRSTSALHLFHSCVFTSFKVLLAPLTIYKYELLCLTHCALCNTVFLNTTYVISKKMIMLLCVCVCTDLAVGGCHNSWRTAVLWQSEWCDRKMSGRKRSFVKTGELSWLQIASVWPLLFRCSWGFYRCQPDEPRDRYTHTIKWQNTWQALLGTTDEIGWKEVWLKIQTHFRKEKDAYGIITVLRIEATVYISVL